MKKISLIFIFFCWSISFIYAQDSTKKIENYWLPENYESVATIKIINSDSALIQKDTAQLGIAIQKEQQKVLLKQAKDNEKVLKLLGLDSNLVNRKYTHLGGLKPTEKLLTTASLSDDGILYIGTTAPIGSDFKELEPVEDFKIQEEKGNNNIIYFILLDILALGLGFWLGMTLKRKKEAEKSKKQASLASSTNVAAGSQDDLNQLQTEIQKLQSENQFLQQRMARALSQLDEANTFDNIYFENVYQAIILPLHESLEHGDKSETLRLLAIAGAQFSSICRSKTNKKVKHDDANIQLLMTGNLQVTEAYPSITRETAIDKTPKNILTLLELLKDENVKDLGDVLVLGYKIKDL